MSDEVRPALSPQEWSRNEVFSYGRRGPRIAADEDSIEFDDGIDPQHGASFRERRHAVGALALHGQPFGFTWADVDAIRREVSLIRSETSPRMQDDPATARQSTIADRIAALLPPREES